jgi:hypothetical protein
MCDEQSAERRPEDKLAALVFEGLDSGDPIEPGPRYWETKHQTLDERLRGTNGQ